MYKNVASQKVPIYARYSNGVAVANIAANIVANISKDGGSCAASNDVSPTQLDYTNAAGIYIFDVTAAETNCDLFLLYPSSNVANVLIDPVSIYTFPGDNAGLDCEVVTKTGFALTSAYDAAKNAASQTSVDALPTSSNIVTAIMSNIVDGTVDVAELLENLVAFLKGGASGATASGGTIVFEKQDGTTSYSITVDQYGNR